MSIKYIGGVPLDWDENNERNLFESLFTQSSTFVAQDRGFPSIDNNQKFPAFPFEFNSTSKENKYRKKN
jgi:hypothetical protein